MRCAYCHAVLTRATVNDPRHAHEWWARGEDAPWPYVNVCPASPTGKHEEVAA